MKPDMKVPVNEFDGKVVYGERRKQKGIALYRAVHTTNLPDNFVHTTNLPDNFVHTSNYRIILLHYYLIVLYYNVILHLYDKCYGTFIRRMKLRFHIVILNYYQSLETTLTKFFMN